MFGEGGVWVLNIIQLTGVPQIDAYFTLIWMGLLCSVGIALPLRLFNKT